MTCTFLLKTGKNFLEERGTSFTATVLAIAEGVGIFTSLKHFPF